MSPFRRQFQQRLLKLSPSGIALLALFALFVPQAAGAPQKEEPQKPAAPLPEVIDELHDKTRELYVVALDSKVQWLQNSMLGVAVAGTMGYLTAFDARSGKVYWQKEMASVPKEAVSIVADMIIVRLYKGEYKEHPISAAYNLVTGEEKWKNVDLTGKILLAVPLYAEGKMFVMASGEALMHAAEAMAKKTVGTMTFGLVGDASKKEIKTDFFYIDMESGSTIWQQANADTAVFHATPVGLYGLGGLEYGVKAYPAPLFNADYSRLYLPYMGLECIDLTNGQRIWIAHYKTTEGSLLQTNAQSIIDDEAGVIYTSGKGKVRAIDKNLGTIIWESKLDYGLVPNLILNKKEGVLYGRTGGTFRDNKSGSEKMSGKLGVVALNLADGSEKWKNQLGFGKATNLVERSDHLAFVGDQKLIGVDKNTGLDKFRTPVTMAGEEQMSGKLGILGLKQFVEAETIEFRPNGKMVMQSDNSLALYDPVNNEMVWNTFVAAPGMTFWDRALVLGIDVIGEELSRQINTVGLSAYFRTALGSISKNMSGEMVNRALMGGSQEAKRNLYFPTVMPDEMKGIAVVNRETGKRETDIVFGKGKNFGYQIDERFLTAYKYSGSKIFGIELSLLKK